MKKESELKKIIIFLAVIIICFIVLYCSYTYLNVSVIKLMIESISISIITAMLVSLVSFLIEKNDFEEAYKELVQKNLPFLFNLNNRGLVFFGNDFPLEEEIYKKDFLESKEITLIMNDGKKFVTNHIDLFKKRFTENQKSTNFIFLNPLQKDSISVLTRKNGHEKAPEYYVDKIKNYSDELKEYLKEFKNHKIYVGYHNFFTTMGILLTDNYAMISLYRISPGKDVVPNLVFEKNGRELSEYNKIKEDVARVLQQSNVKNYLDETGAQTK